MHNLSLCVVFCPVINAQIRRQFPKQKGLTMAKKRYYSSAGKMGGEMISGASRGHANMPQEVIMKYYPKSDAYLNEDINDGIRGIDVQKMADVKDMKKDLSPTKY